MLTACFDGAGKGGDSRYKVIVVAGFASFSKPWSELGDRWSQRLAQDNLPYFHAGDFAHSSGPFSDGWKDNEPRRRLLTRDLMGIIEDCGLRKFGCILRLEDHKKVCDRRNVKMDEFAFAAMKAVESFRSHGSAEGAGQAMRCIFEKGDPEEELRQLFRYYKIDQPVFAWSRPHKDAKGTAHEPVIGLQAAGWIAYEYYLDAQRLLYSEPTSRWAFERFEKLPGFLTLHSGPLVPKIPEMTPQYKSVLKATRKLTEIKAQKQ